jgi:hypothetical protein
MSSRIAGNLAALRKAGIAFDARNRPAGETVGGASYSRACNTTGTTGIGLFSDDLVAKVEYPDKSTGAASTSASDDTSATYDLSGGVRTSTDQNGTTHTLVEDVLGREGLDSVTTLGSGVDGAVLARGYTYAPNGQLYLATSYSNAGGTTVVNWR